MIRVIVQREDFDTGALLEQLSAGNTGIGGVASFTGLVRDFGPQSAMTLEHYPGMTERELERIAQEAMQRWPLEGVLVVHRYGRLLPGDRIVLTAAASAHRQAAFDACLFMVDWLKTQAPFWKLEESSGERRWVEAKAADDDAAARWEKR
jgi:molybdopterin synthase catalytic subunit